MSDLILALDKLDEQGKLDYGVLSLLTRCKDVDGFKITVASLFDDWYREFWGFCSMMGSVYNKYYKVLLDLKLADVGVFGKEERWVGTNSEIVKSAAYHGIVTHITVHAFPGRYSVREAIETAATCGAEVILLTGMTHKGADQFMCQPQYMDDVVLMGEEFNVGGYVAPGNDIDFLSRLRTKTNRDIWSPGFGRQVTLRGGENINISEQIKRWRSIVESEIHDGNVIVGSYIINDDEPEERISEILEILK